MESYGLLQRILEDTMKQQLAIKTNQQTNPKEQTKHRSVQTQTKQTTKKLKTNKKASRNHHLTHTT